MRMPSVRRGYGGPLSRFETERLVLGTDCAPFNSARPRCPSSPGRLDGHSELFVSLGSRRRQNTRSGRRGRLGPWHPTSNDRAYRQTCRQQPRWQDRPAETRRLCESHRDEGAKVSESRLGGLCRNADDRLSRTGRLACLCDCAAVVGCGRGGAEGQVSPARGAGLVANGWTADRVFSNHIIPLR